MTAIYPTNIATDADLLSGVNNLQTALDGLLGASGDNTGGNGIALTSTVNFPAAGVVTIENEIVYYTAVVGNNLTGTVRGFDNTLATTHNSGVPVSLDFIAGHHNFLRDEIESIEDDLLNGIRPNAFQNILVNPSFESWQRGVTFSNVANGTLTADKWYANHNGAPSFVVSRTSLAGVIISGQYALLLQLSVIGGSTTLTVQQDIENYKDYRGKTVSFSIWVNSSVPGIKAFITNGTISTSLSAAHPGGSTYQRLTCTYMVPSNSNQLTVGVGFIDVSPSLSTVYVDSGMFTFGTKASDYIPVSPADDAARCQRYYETLQFSYKGYASSSAIYYLPFSYKVAKANVPTITTSPGTSANVSLLGSAMSTINGFSLAITTASSGDFGVGLPVTAASWTAETT